MTESYLTYLLALGLFIISFLYRREKLNKKELLKSQARKDSLEKSRQTIFGQSAEKIAPFLSAFGYDPQKAQFLGQPIDYVVFEDDEVVFVEIKTGKASLSTKQRRIRDLIKEKKVTWKEVRI